MSDIEGMVTIALPGASQQIVVWLGDGGDPLYLLDEMGPLDLPDLSAAQRAVARARLLYWADVLAEATA